MRLLKIGSSQDCDIVLNSRKVSALHAEITLLNNGDILLEDKGSTNGTYVNNDPNRLHPGVLRPIKKGDLVRFADMELPWSAVPQLDYSMFKKVYGIGSNMQFNEIKVPGSSVSRFHATLLIDNRGRAYIEDHSMNGTTINGKKIPSHHRNRIKRGDDVVVGGVPVNLKQFIKPNVGSTFLKVVGGFATVAALVVLLMVVVNPNNEWPWKKVKPAELVSATVYVQACYHYTAKIVDDPFASLCKQYNIAYSSEYQIGANGKGEMGFISEDGEFGPMWYSGTAFFVSSDGKMITNRHVAAPWKFATENETSEIHRLVTKMKEQNMSIDHLRTMDDLYELIANKSLISNVVKALFDKDLMSVEDLDAIISKYKRCEVKISGELDYIAVGYPNRHYTDIDELERCLPIAEAKDDNVDLALLQLNSTATPASVKKVFDLDNALVDSKRIKPLEAQYYYIGYPKGAGLNLRENGLFPQNVEVKISRVPDRYTADLQGEVLGGASGSPVFDKKGRLVGVISFSYRNASTMSGCVLAKYAKELYDEFEAR